MSLRLLCTILITLFSLPINAEEHIFTPMIGVVNWSDESGHVARGSALSFDDDNEMAFGFRYLYRFDSGFAAGGNIYLYDKDVATSGQANDAGVAHVHALAEYFFNANGDVSPFLGGGIGFASIGFDGGTLDDESTGGLSIELNGGVLFRLSEYVGIQAEYKYVNFEMDDDIDGFRSDIESDIHSVFIGVTIHL